MEQFVGAPLPRDEQLALVDDWDCLRVSLCRLACSPPGLLRSLSRTAFPDWSMRRRTFTWTPACSKIPMHVQSPNLHAGHARVCCCSPHLVPARKHPRMCATGWALIPRHAGHGGGVGGQLRHPGPVRHAALAHLCQPVQRRRACRRLRARCRSAVRTGRASVLSIVRQQGAAHHWQDAPMPVAGTSQTADM